MDEKRVEAAAAALMARLHASDYTYALTIEDAQDMATIVLDAFFSAGHTSLSSDMRISLSHAIDSRFRTLDSTLQDIDAILAALAKRGLTIDAAWSPPGAGTWPIR